MAPRTARVAKPELKEQMILLHGTAQGYSRWVRDIIAIQPTSDGTPIGSKSTTMVNQVLNGARTVPIPFVLGLTRLAEENIELSDAEALELSAKWFDIKEV